jgi:hypothetical protein
VNTIADGVYFFTGAALRAGHRRNLDNDPETQRFLNANRGHGIMAGPQVVYHSNQDIGGPTEGWSPQPRRR